MLGNPVVAAALFFGSLVVFYYSPLFELSLRTHTGHVLMVIHFLLTGYLFAWVLIGVDPGPPKWAPSLRLLILFATISFHAFFGVALTTGTTLLAPDFFEQLHLPWGPDLLVDQRNAGAVAWGVGEVPTLLLAMLVALAWVRSDAARDPPRGPPGRPRRRRGAQGLQRAPRRGRRRATRSPPACRETDMRIALIQLGYDDAASVADRTARAAALVRAQRGHDLVVLPELWAPGGFDYRAWSERAETVDGPTAQAMAAAARDAGVVLHAGLDRRAPARRRARPGGQGPVEHLAGLRRRTARCSRRTARSTGSASAQGEPSLMEAGERARRGRPAGRGRRHGARAGLSTCYDLRFPELYRAQLDAGADRVRRPRRVADGPGRALDPARPAPARSRTSASSWPATPPGTHAGTEMGGASMVVLPTGEVRGGRGKRGAGAQR